MYFNELDPIEFQLNDPISRARRKRQQAMLPTPEQEQSMLSAIGGTAASGVGAFGNFFDIPGSMVRDVLSGVATGDWRANNPFDQLLSPFSGENRTTGRDVLANFGLASENDPDSWEAADFAGFGADVLLDPLTYIGGLGLLKGVGKTGQLAKRTGLAGKTLAKGGSRTELMTESIGSLLKKAPELTPVVEESAKKMGLNLADELDKPLGGLLNVGIPGTKISKSIGTGKTAQYVGGLLDELGEGIKATAPIRAIRQGFDPTVMGQSSKYGQQLGEEIYTGTREARHEARTLQSELWKPMYEAFEKFRDEIGDPAKIAGATNFPSKDFGLGDAVRAGDKHNVGRIVGATPQGKIKVHFRNKVNGRATVKEFSEQDLKLAHPKGSSDVENLIEDEMFRAFDRLSFYAHESKKGVTHAFSEILPGVQVSGNLAKSMEDATQHVMNAIDTLHSHAQDLGVNINWIGSDTYAYAPRFVPRAILEQQQGARLADLSWNSAKHRTPVTSEMPREVVHNLLKDEKARHLLAKKKQGLDSYLSNAYGKYQPAQIADKDEYLGALKTYLKQHDPLDLYTNTGINDAFKYVENGLRATKTTEAIHRFLGRNLADITPDTSGALIPIADVFERVGMNPKAIAHIAEQSGKSLNDLANMGVDREVVDAIMTASKLFDPQYKTAIGSAIDTFNKWFKGSVTVPFPNFHFRNHTGGQSLNMLAALDSPADILSYIKTYIRTWKQGQTPLKDLAGLDKERVELMHIFDVGSDKYGPEGIELIGTARHAESRHFQPPELKDVFNVKKAYKETKRDLIDKADAAGLNRDPRLLKSRAAYESVIRAGSQGSQLVEWQNRATLFNYLMDKGYSAEQAANRVRELHFDYSDLTPLERQIKRVVPFYSFTRKMSELTFKELANKPGGGVSQAIQATAQGSNSANEFIPEWVSQTASIPWGENEAGNKTYLTGLGMPWEDPLSFFSTDPAEIGLEFMSRTTPLVKGPAEYFTGQSFFQRGPTGGRNLEDLDPTIGRTISNLIGAEDPVNILPGSAGRAAEHLAANSPLSRIFTTGRQLSELALLGTDKERKSALQIAANLLTGLRFATVSPQARDKAIRDLVSSRMSDYPQARAFEQSYIPKDVKARMSERDREDIEMMESLNRLLGKRARDRKKDKLKAQR